MDDDERDLANRLFARATATAEDAAGLAVAGQSPRLSAARLADLACRLKAAARDLGILAGAAAIVAGSGDSPEPPPEPPR